MPIAGPRMPLGTFTTPGLASSLLGRAFADVAGLGRRFGSLGGSTGRQDDGITVFGAGFGRLRLALDCGDFVRFDGFRFHPGLDEAYHAAPSPAWRALGGGSARWGARQVGKTMEYRCLARDSVGFGWLWIAVISSVSMGSDSILDWTRPIMPHLRRRGGHWAAFRWGLDGSVRRWNNRVRRGIWLALDFGDFGRFDGANHAALPPAWRTFGGGSARCGARRDGKTME